MAASLDKARANSAIYAWSHRSFIVFRLRLHYRNVTAHLQQVYDFHASPGLFSTLDERMISGSQISSLSLPTGRKFTLRKGLKNEYV